MKENFVNFLTVSFPLCDSSDTLCLAIEYCNKRNWWAMLSRRKFVQKKFLEAQITPIFIFQILLLKISCYQNEKSVRKMAGNWSDDQRIFQIDICSAAAEVSLCSHHFLKFLTGPTSFFVFSNIYLLIWKKMTLILYVHFTSYRKFMWKKGKTQMELSKPTKIVHKFNSHHELKKKYWYNYYQKSLDTDLYLSLAKK